MAAFYMVCDRWRQQVDGMDFVRLHGPSLSEISEACRRDPLNSKYRVVAATEMRWTDPDEVEDADARALARRQLTRFTRSPPNSPEIWSSS